MQIQVSLTLEVPASGDIDSLEPLVLEAGRQAMAKALRAASREYEARVVACPRCHHERLQSEGTDRRVLLLSFGRVELPLRRLRCEHCHLRFRPADVLLGPLAGTSVTSKLRQVAVLAGTSWPYATAAKVLRELCGALISPEWIRQLTIQVGTKEKHQKVQAAQGQLRELRAEDVRRERETELSAGLSSQGECPELLMVGLDGGWVPSRERAGGMEGKVGVIASEVEEVGRGRRRLSRRRYVASFADGEVVGALSYAAAEALGGEQAKRQVVLGDGANWIKSQAELHFPWAEKILDWPHLARAVHRAIRSAKPGKSRQEERKRLHQQIPGRLWCGDVDGALEELRRLRPGQDAEPVVALGEAIGYVEGQRDWIGDYQGWRDQGYPVGSGLVERAVELVINRRLKGRGMRWLTASADAVVALRVQTLNDDWDTLTNHNSLAA